jgi:hypothetical protein
MLTGTAWPYRAARYSYCRSDFSREPADPVDHSRLKLLLQKNPLSRVRCNAPHESVNHWHAHWPLDVEITCLE